MVDTYSKLLGLTDTTPPLPDPGKEKLVQTPIKQEKKTRLLANQQTSKDGKKKTPHVKQAQTDEKQPTSLPLPSSPAVQLDSSLLTTKEKTKYGTYLTDESIEKIRIHAIQTKRDDHQVVQEAVDRFFERLEK